MASSSSQAADPNYQGSDQLRQTQAQVQEVVGIMRMNVERVLERDNKLSDLDQRADVLQHGASQFEQQARRVKQRQWWANMKMNIIIGVIITVIMIIIIVSFLPSSNGSNTNNENHGTISNSSSI